MSAGIREMFWSRMLKSWKLCYNEKGEGDFCPSILKAHSKRMSAIQREGDVSSDTPA